MEIRVKERLIGALILVALIVLLVPELLSGPRQPSGSNTRDPGAVQTYTIDLGAPSGGAPPARAREPDARPPDPEPATVTSPSGAGTGIGTVSVEPPPGTADVQPEETPAAPETTATTSAPSAPDASAESAWAVQLGSFENEDNAARLVKDLKKRGYKAFVSRTGSGSRTRYRARVGPEQDRSRAENLADRLRHDGHPGVVVPQP
ncbi:MAG TPA: SPOR domain-containing protein [Steroidobacteraceae bacterium]|jgi:DedD protein|nr:SPOR domain-containing protein [Steroidobacteraceae bacterium]